MRRVNANVDVERRRLGYLKDDALGEEDFAADLPEDNLDDDE